MPNYLLLLHEDPAAFEHVSPEEMQAIIQKYSEWKRRMQSAGVMVGGQKLQDGTGRVLRRTAGHTAATDGPYAESKEVIGGFLKSAPRIINKPSPPRSIVRTSSMAPLRYARSSLCPVTE